MPYFINRTIFEGQLRDGTPCECFVEGVGYAFTMAYSAPPLHRQSNNPRARVSDEDSFTQNCILQFLDVSSHMRMKSNNYLHKVKQGENLTIISRQYDISVESIKSANPDIDWVGERRNGHYIYPGEVLKLPKKGNPQNYQFMLMSVIEPKCKVINNTNNFWTRFWSAFHQIFIVNNAGGYMFWSDNATGSGYVGGQPEKSIDITGLDTALSAQTGGKPNGFAEAWPAFMSALSSLIQEATDAVKEWMTRDQESLKESGFREDSIYDENLESTFVKKSTMEMAVGDSVYITGYYNLEPRTLPNGYITEPVTYHKDRLIPRMDTSKYAPGYKLIDREK